MDVAAPERAEAWRGKTRLMVTADQLVAHVVGDYVLQSDWMAAHKSRRSLPALVHAALYSVPFLFLSPSSLALLIIFGSHFVIDRWRLARYVSWATNLLAPLPHRSWAECQATGYAPERPLWMAQWLLVIVDNTLHVLINAWALALH
jgi:hypothetical protein